MQKRRFVLQLTLFACLIALLISTLALPVAATDAEPALDEARAVCLYHIEGGTTVIAQNADQSIAAGSAVKILSGLLFCEALVGREAELVTITPEMVATSGGRSLGIRSGDEIPIGQLLYAALCGSYNDAYDVLACLVAGTREAFVAQMNQKAAELGASETQASDPSGIDDVSQTTASDICKIALAASKNQLYMQLCNTTRYHFFATELLTERTLNNPNALLSTTTVSGFYDSRCQGMSAGMTGRGGGCVITLASNGKESYLSVVMGAKVTQNDKKQDVNHAYTVTNRLVDWVFDAYAYLDVITPETELCTIPVTVSDLTTEVTVRAGETLSFYLPRNLEIGKDITYSIRLIYEELEAPVEVNTFVGYVAILWNGKTLGTVPLYTVESAERSSFVSSLKQLRALTESRVFRAGAIFFVVATAIWITAETLILRHRRHKWDKYFSDKMTLSPGKSTEKKTHGRSNRWN